MKKRNSFSVTWVVRDRRVDSSVSATKCNYFQTSNTCRLLGGLFHTQGELAFDITMS